MKKSLGSILFVLLTSLLSAQQIERRTYYDQEESVLKEIFHIKDTISNLLSGPYTSFYLSGRKKTEGFYFNNKASGEWQYYYENGRISQKGEFLHGRSVGIWAYYYENGNLRSEGILSNNKKGGEWSYYYEDGSLKSKGDYDLELKAGTWTYYYEGGGLKARANFEGGSGIYEEYFVSGQMKMKGLNRMGKSDSLWVYYYESGERMAEGYYKEGVKMGPWKYFYKGGQVSAEGGYDHGETLGNWIYYYADGEKSAEGLQKKGLKDGYWKMFYETGETKGVGDFEEGTGRYKEYYVSGKLKVDGQFKDDLNFGKWTYHDEEGHVEGVAHFNEKGVGIYEGFYLNGDKKMSGKVSQGRRIGEWTLYKKNGEVAGKYHPVYEDASPIFMNSESFINQAKDTDYDKPEYRFKNKKSRYFTPRVNEYKGVFFGSNPLYTLMGYLPINIEYYLQERQGFEVTYTYHRKPFFQDHAQLSSDKVYSTGGGFSFKHKFYSEDQKIGMTYFAYVIGGNWKNHQVNITELTKLTAQTKENKYYGGLIIGDRWVKDPANAGITIDAFVGVGVGMRDYSKNYSDTSYDSYFESIDQSKLYIPVFFGVNIGYLGFKKVKNTIPSPR